MNKNKLYKFSENTLSLFSIKAIDLALTIWLIPYLIWKVGFHNYGVYAFAMALLLFFVNVLNYGFNLSAVRELAKNKDKAYKVNEIFNEVFSVKLVLFGFLFLFIIVLIFMIPEFWVQKQLYFFASFLLIAELFSLRWFFMGMEQMKFKSIITITSTFIYISLLLIFMDSESDYIFIPLYESVALISVALIAFLWVVKRYKMKVKIISFNKIKYYLKVNFSSFINLLLPSTYGTVIVFLVGLLGVPAFVSYMQVGVKYTGAFATTNTVLTKALYPIVNRNEKIKETARLLLMSIGIVFSILMYFSSQFLLGHWIQFDSQEDLSKAVLMIQLLSPIPFLLGIVSSYGINGLLTLKKDVLYLKITLIATIVMIAIAGLLIPKYHYYGGAISLLMAWLFYAILSWFSFKKANKNV